MREFTEGSLNHPNDSWIRVWIEGNSLVPQYSLAINILVLACVLSDGCFDLNSIPGTLSEEQLNLARQNKYKAHAAYKIRGKIDGSDINYGQEDKRGDVDTIWEFTSSQISNFIRTCIREDLPPEQVSLAILKLKEAIDTKEFKEIARAYRESFRGHITYQNAIDRNGFKVDMSHFLLKKLREFYISLPKCLHKAFIECFDFYIALQEDLDFFTGTEIIKRDH